MTSQARTIIVKKLLDRRAALQAQLDDVLSKPASYTIQGSYSQTSQTAETLRKEIAAIDTQIRCVRHGEGQSISRIYPDYS